MKVNGSFKGVNPSDNHNSAGKRITQAAIITGAVVGGAVLCSKGKNSILQRFAGVLTNDILAPLQQKGVPFNEKIANIGESLRRTITSFTSKRNNYVDILDIVPAQTARTAPKKPLLALPEKTTATIADEIDASLKGLLYKSDNQLIFDIPVVSNAGGTKETRILALPAPKNVLALPEKTGDAARNIVQRGRDNGEVLPLPRVIELPGEIAPVQDAAESVLNNIGKTAAAAGAVLAGGAAIAAAGSDKKDAGIISPADKKDETKALGKKETPAEVETPGEETLQAAKAVKIKETEEAEEAKETEEAKEPALHDETKIITLDGKEFGGIFENGIAYDEKYEPLTGKLVVDFKSGKAAVVQYENGVLQKSVIFEHKEDAVPKEIKTYKNGKIHQKFTGLELKDGAFDAKKTYTYRPSDSMLQRTDTVDRGVTHTRQYKNNTDEAGKIIGKPLPVLGTDIRTLSNGVERRTFRVKAPGGRDDELARSVRISETMTDGTKHIQLIGNNNQAVGTIWLDLDKKIDFYIPGSKNDSNSDGYLSFKDGKLVHATTDTVIASKETLIEYVGYKYSGSKITPLEPLEEGKKPYEVSHETTAYYTADNGATVAITTHEGSRYVKKIEQFDNKDDETPVSSRTYSKGDKITIDYFSNKSPLSGDDKTKLVIKQGDSKVSFPQLERLECADDTMEAFIGNDGSVIEIEKDENGYVTSIAGYADEWAEYPEFITTFDHGTPLQDRVFDEDGNVIFNAKYSVTPAPKPEPVKIEPKVPTKAESKRNLDGHVSFNDTYNIKTFYGDIWEGTWFNSKPVKEIKRDENDAYEVSLLNPYKPDTTTYSILLDENRTIQRLTVYDAKGETVELFMDEEGHLEVSDLKYALNQGDLVKIGPFKKENVERYRTRQGEVIEFVKNEDGTVASIAYYEDETRDIPVCRTFLKGGAPTRDVLYDEEDGEVLHISDYKADMENIENPLEDRHYFGNANPLSFRIFNRDGKAYGLTQKERELYYGREE